MQKGKLTSGINQELCISEDRLRDYDDTCPLTLDLLAAPGFVKTAIFDTEQYENTVGPYVGTAYAEPLINMVQYLHWSSQKDRAHEPEIIAR